MAPFDFFVLPKMKEHIRFESIESVWTRKNNIFADKSIDQAAGQRLLYHCLVRDNVQGYDEWQLVGSWIMS